MAERDSKSRVNGATRITARHTVKADVKRDRSEKERDRATTIVKRVERGVGGECDGEWKTIERGKERFQQWTENVEGGNTVGERDRRRESVRCRR